jgi:hypothetical protein
VENASFVFVVAGVSAGAALYWFILRPRLLNWGAARREIEASMPGDDVIRDATHVATRSVTISAQAEDVWPWLAQMGYRRGGLYAYDWIDRLCGILDGPSAERIIPEFQRLAVRDEIPMGSGSGWPVKALEANCLLLLHIKEPGTECTWVWQLSELDESHTRLVLRVRTRLTSPLLALLFHLSDPGSFLMTRKHLLGIKRRAEVAAWQSDPWLTDDLRRAGPVLPPWSSRHRHPSL